PAPPGIHRPSLHDALPICDFYEGELAEKVVAFSKACDGALTLDDLRNFRPEWVEPIAKDYHGYTLHEIPPNGQGIAALIALGIRSEEHTSELQSRENLVCR